MNEKLIVLFADIFSKRIAKGEDGFMILKSSLALRILSNLYEQLCLVDVPKIETLPLEQKTSYWLIAKQFYNDHKMAIQASKAAYMICLITNTD